MRNCLNYYTDTVKENYFERCQYIDDRREETRMMTRGTSEKGGGVLCEITN